MISLIHWLTHFISWIICIFVVITNISLTGILWWNYSKNNRNNTNENGIVFAEYINNECTIYVLAIIATIVMVGICYLKLLI